MMDETALKKAAREVEYELLAIEAAARHLDWLQAGAAPSGPLNADWIARHTLEALLIHARNLHDFFKGGGQGTPVQAHNFFDDGERWSGNIRKRARDLQEAQHAIDVALAHISVDRPMPRDWTYGRITDQVLGLAGEFKRNLTGERRGWFRREDLHLPPQPPEITDRSLSTASTLFRTS